MRRLILFSLTLACLSALAQEPRRLRPVVVDGRQERALHVLAYVREYSTLSTFTDTITLFREKMADFMLPPSPRSKMPAWRLPRVIGARSYYRFTSAQGLDSVSDRCAHHFSWADWVGMPPAQPVPEAVAAARDTMVSYPSRWGTAERWSRAGAWLDVGADLLVSDHERRWTPDAAAFFRREDVDFEQFDITLRYELADTLTARPLDLRHYAVHIASRGRGRSMFRFGQAGEPVFVTTRAEVYILDREFVTLPQARLWAAGRNDVDIYVPADAPALPAEVQRLIARVEGINHDSVRVELPTDQRLAHTPVRMTFGKAVMQRIKQMFGLDVLAGDRKQKKDWNRFRRRQSRTSAPQREE